MQAQALKQIDPSAWPWGCRVTYAAPSSGVSKDMLKLHEEAAKVKAIAYSITADDTVTFYSPMAPVPQVAHYPSD
jgi:hypothetical protein